MFAHRNYLAVWYLAVALFLGLATPRDVNAANNWEYVPELQGWLDWDTGLVWGDYWPIYERWGYCRWSFTATTFLNQHRIDTGIPDWRMATIAEVQTIAADQLYLAWFPDWQPGDPHPWPTYTSETRGKKYAYVVDFFTGTAWLSSQQTYCIPMPVYRLFTP